MRVRPFSSRSWCAVFGVLALAVSPTSGLAADAKDHEAKALDRVVRSFVDADRFSGVVLVVHHQQLVLRRGYGLRDREWNLPNVPEGRFRIGSLTKSFTAAAVLQLVDAGRLSLTDSLAKFIPNAPDNWQDVTVEELLNHTSGIASYTQIRPTAPRLDRTPQELIDQVKAAPPNFPPGTDFRYNNSGYLMLARIIELVSGESYKDYIRRHLLKPLGLENTGFDENEDILPERVSGYIYRDGVWKHGAYYSMSQAYSSGGLYSTVDDMNAWMQALFSGKVLSPEQQKRMFSDGGHGYGFAWFIPKPDDHPLIYHTGSIDGFTSIAANYPADELRIIVLANEERIPIKPLSDAVASAALGLKQGRIDVLSPTDSLDRYVGDYELNPRTHLRFSRSGEGLQVACEDFPPQRLRAEGHGVFASDILGATFQFAEGNGLSMSVAFKHGSTQSQAQRVPPKP